MPKTRQQKEQVLRQLVDNLSSAKAATLASFTKISVKDDQALRRNLRQAEVKYSVIKKTLLKKAFEKLNFPIDELDNWQGNISMAISDMDEIVSAKLIANFIKDNESMDILGGLLENKWMNAQEIKALAKLPSKQELVAKTVGTIKAPLNGLVNVLAGNLRNLLGVLRAIQEEK